jgi:hypothetical protein
MLHLNMQMPYSQFKICLTSLVFISICFCAKGQSRIALFNGKDLKGWHMDVPDRDTHPELRIPFIVRNGLLVSLGTPEGHLITDKIYADYTLTLQYRFAGETGNCGVLVHASTPRILYKMFPKSVEAQLMHTNAGDFWCIGENITVPDMVNRRGPKENWGVTEGMERRVLNLTDGSEYPPGKWNTMKIRCKKDTITVWINDDMVNHGFNCTATRGQIALQAEGAEVEFKNIYLEYLKRKE